MTRRIAALRRPYQRRPLPPPHRPHRRQAGHTLLEWLIAATLGLVVIGGSLALYRAQREAFSRSVEAARMYEAGAAALMLVGQQLQMAGFAPVDQPALRGRVTPGLYGCEAARPAAGGAGDEPACEADLAESLLSSHWLDGSASARASDSDGVVVRYLDDGAATWRGASGEPTDCLGQGVARRDGYAVIVNRFYVAQPMRREAPELYCGGSGRTSMPQPLVEGVERLKLRYWLRGAPEPVGARRVAPNRWADVVAVDLCVVVRGRTARARKTYVDCDGKWAAGADGRERVSLSRHLVLRNQAPAG